MLGACGMGVGPLAIYLKESGNEVYGWDDSTGSPMENHLANADIPLLKDPWAAGRKPSLIGQIECRKILDIQRLVWLKKIRHVYFAGVNY
jgi:UDP-N-acetylmuramate-alanine ligase